MADHSKNNQQLTFSDELEAWLKGDTPKTVAGLDTIMAEKSFAIIFLLLMALPALPIPTGGATHVFEIIVILVALQALIGMRGLWLPKRWLNRPLGKTILNRTLPGLIRFVRKVEAISRPRMSMVIQTKVFLQIISLPIIIFTMAAFVAPPFSFLDTFPSLAVVLISLGIILNDIVPIIAGLVLGAGSLFALWTIITSIVTRVF